jgi:hypothetical protein
MSGSKCIEEQTRAEWEALGFFYDYNDSQRAWLVRASRAGMDRLCTELRQYAKEPRNGVLSEHEHYGPYSYLKFVTWTEPRVVADGIYGRLQDFERLADIVSAVLAGAKPGTRVRVDETYSQNSEAKLELLLEHDDFEVASADPALATR